MSAAAAEHLGRAYVRTLVVAALMGAPVAAAALVFTSSLHGATHVIWTTIPRDAGWAEPPWWYVLLVPTIGGGLVAGALRLPGRGGHPPTEGLGLDFGSPLGIFSALLAAFASLVAGAVLGPEAPVMALGLTLGVVAARLVRADPAQTKLLAVAGAFAAMSALFGGPLPSSLLLFEVMAAGGIVVSAGLGRALVPGLVAAGTGTLLFTGVHHWKGVHESQLSVPGLPAYPTVQARDVAWCVLLAALTGMAVALARPIAKRLATVASRRVIVGLLLGGLAVGILAIVFRGATDRPVDLVLFSGQGATGPLIAEGSGGVLLAVVGFKGAAYVVSLANGFRGGPIFPTVAFGVALGAAGSIVLPGLALTPAVVAGMAAGAAGGMRLPFFGAVLAALLSGRSFADTTPIAIIAAVTGWLAALAVDRALPTRAHTIVDGGTHGNA
jgi:H+/Cl- antiporter ClcA